LIASEYCSLVCNNPVTSTSHFLASVFISYWSPMFTAFDAFVFIPLCFTLLFAQASEARVRVLKIRIAHRYLSSRSFSLPGIFKFKKLYRQIKTVMSYFYFFKKYKM